MSSHHLLPYRASDDEESCADQDFHHHGTEDFHDPDKSTSGRRTQILSRVSFLNIWFAVCNLTVFVFLMLAHHVDQCIHPTSAQSPVAHIVRYNSTYFDKYGHLGGNPFSQPPGPELDNAWHGLLRGMNIAVEPEWLDQHNATSVRLVNRPGLLVQLGLYHELHCLKKLKHWNYRDHYYSNLLEEDWKEEEIHIEHCLEWLRVAALCRSDVTLTTFQWEGVNGSRLATEYPIPRQCVDSERVLEWSEARAVNITQEGILEHA